MRKIIDLKNLLKLIFIFLLFYCSKLFQYIPIILLNLDIKNISNSSYIILSIFSSLCLLIILIFIYRKDLKKYFKKLKNNFIEIMDNSFKSYLLGVFFMMISNVIISMLLKDSGPNNEKLVQEMINISPILMFINAGLIAPIVEELVFRKAYMDTFKTKWLFILISGFIFGLMHVITSSNNTYQYLYIIPYMSLGISFAYMDYKNKNVLPSIIMHMFHNSVLVILSVFI